MTHTLNPPSPPAASAAPSRFEGEEPARRITAVWVVTGGVLLAGLALLGLLLRLTQSAGVMTDQWFYAILTLHSAGMVAVTLMALAATVWYIVHDQLPLSVRVNALTYGLSVLGAVLVVISTLVGRFGTGWTFLYPLPDHPGPLPGWNSAAAYPYFIGVALVALAFAIWGLDILRAGLKRFGNPGRLLGLDILTGRTKPDDPGATSPTIIAATVMAFEGVLTVIPGAIIVVLMILANATGFTMPALFAKEMIYFTGHMLVNFDIYLGAGIAYAVLPKYANRAWPATKPVVIAWLATLVLIIFPYFHHLYMDFAQPAGLSIVGQIASYGSALPSAVVTIFGGVLLVHRSGLRWQPAPLFIYAGFAGWTIGGTGALIDSTPSVNEYFHNTLWVPGHFHTYMAMGALMFLLGGVYHATPALTGRPLSERVGSAGARLILIGGWVVVLTFFASGAMSIPRRYSFIPFSKFEMMATVGLIGACIAGLGVVLIAGDVLRVYLPGLRAPTAPLRPTRPKPPAPSAPEPAGV